MNTDIMDRYEAFKRNRDMHRNMSRVAVTAEVRGIHARHADEFQVMINAMRQDVVASLGWSV